MTKFITSRYYLHLIVGLAIGYNLTSLSDFNEYAWYNEIVGVVAITFIAFWYGFFWERLRSQLFGIKLDWNDVSWSAFGGLIGSILCFIFWSNDYIFYGNLILIITFVGRDIYRRTVKNNR